MFLIFIFRLNLLFIFYYYSSNFLRAKNLDILREAEFPPPIKDIPKRNTDINIHVHKPQNHEMKHTVFMHFTRFSYGLHIHVYTRINRPIKPRALVETITSLVTSNKNKNVIILIIIQKSSF